MRRPSSVVMPATVGTVIAARDLSKGVLAGIVRHERDRRPRRRRLRRAFWDISAVAALDKVVLKARRNGKHIEVRGLTRPAPP